VFVTTPGNKNLGFWALVAIGVGGMVGGGIFAVLGLAVTLAGGGTPIAFAVAGVIALITSYSYARLAVAFPHDAGTVAYLNQAFGPGYITGSLNVLLWLGYIVTLSLYAYAFGSYGAGLFPPAYHPLAKHLLVTGVIVAMTSLNVLGASAMGKAEVWIVGLKTAILLLFVGVGLWGVDGGRLAPATWAGTRQLVAGGMVIFIAYEGFQLIANAANDVRDPGRELPRALFTAVGFVICLYVAIAIVAVGNLPLPKIVSAKDYALAVAAEPFLGGTGYLLITVAALASTASALNATLYGVTRLSYTLVTSGQLPAALDRKVWKKPLGGLLLSAAITLALANILNLSRIATMGSAGFLVIFGAVNVTNLRLRRRTRAVVWLPATGAVLCLLALAALIWETVKRDPYMLWVLAGLIAAALGIEGSYRAFKRGDLRIAALKNKYE
jgi:amino acid transporter